MKDDVNEVCVLFTPLHLSTAIPPSGILLRLTRVMLRAWLKIQRFIGLGWTSRDPVPQRWPNGDPQARSSPPEQPEAHHCSLPPVIHPPSGKPPGGKQGLGGWMSCHTSPHSLPLGFLAMGPHTHTSAHLSKKKKVHISSCILHRFSTTDSDWLDYLLNDCVLLLLFCISFIALLVKGNTNFSGFSVSCFRDHVLLPSAALVV